MGIAFFATFVVAQAFARPKVSRVESNLEAQLHHGDELVIHQEIAETTSFFERVIRPALKRANNQTSGRNSILLRGLRGKGGKNTSAHKVSELMKIADYPWGLSLEEFQLLQVGAGIGFAALGILLAVAVGSPILFLVAIFLAAMGYKYPESLIQKKAQAKQQAVVDQYQSVCDMLALSSDAGLGLIPTLERVATRMPGKLSEELVRTLGDIQYGMAEETAFNELQSRCGLEEINVFVQNILQSRRLGTPAAQVFRNLAEQSRTSAANRAEAQAQKLTVKLIPVIAIFIFLPLLGVIGGPAIFSIHASGF